MKRLGYLSCYVKDQDAAVRAVVVAGMHLLEGLLPGRVPEVLT